MANVLLGVTGSVAAVYTPELVADLTTVGHAVKVVATRSALYFFDPLQVARTADGWRDPNVMILDEDEWPGERYRRGDPVLHVELRRWADLLLLAPLDANTLAKLALGMADNCLTCVWRAWDRDRPIVLAPAMNTLMWEHPATGRHLKQIEEDVGVLRVVPPVSKRLACDEVGVGGLAERATIIAAVGEMLTR